MQLRISKALFKSDITYILGLKKKINTDMFGVEWPQELHDAIAPRMADKAYNGEKAAALTVFSARTKNTRVELRGLPKNANKMQIRDAVEACLKHARKAKAKAVTILVPEVSCLEMAISGAFSGNYTYKLTEEKADHQVEILNIWTPKKVSQEFIDAQVAEADAISHIRYMVDTPANLMTPDDMADEAAEVAKLNKKLKLKVLGEDELEKLGMKAILGVGQGSANETKVLVFEYLNGPKDEAPVAFIGKGVVYDTGGYNLKPTGHIETMKCDMAGAATVIGLMRYLAMTEPKKNIIGVCGCVENMISDRAYKPGDIIGSYSGKTIKVTNTDAEGRLALADCISYTKDKYKPRQILDAATLTGAVVAAIGYEYTGFISTNGGMTKQLMAAGKEAGEQYWELPLTDHFKEKTKGDICDLLNWTKGVSAGCSMAAAFLSNFVEDTPWMHFDIAGTAYNGKYGHGCEEGATGTLLRTWRRYAEGL